MSLRRLENLLPGNSIEISSHCQYLSTSHDSSGIAYVYQLKGYESRLRRDCLYHGKAKSYNLTLVIECRYQLMHSGSLTWLTGSQSLSLSPSPPNTIFEFDRNYHLRIFHEREYQFEIDYMQKESLALACDITNPFSPDLQGYVHRFYYW